jgi:acid stress-induced BolA-like protein IbaG/YrbA
LAAGRLRRQETSFVDDNTDFYPRKIMNPEKIEQLLVASMEDADIKVEGMDGKYMVSIVSDSFTGLNAVKRQQVVYRILNTHIASGAIHAVSMQLRTRAEYANL